MMPRLMASPPGLVVAGEGVAVEEEPGEREARTPPPMEELVVLEGAGARSPAPTGSEASLAGQDTKQESEILVPWAALVRREETGC